MDPAGDAAPPARPARPPAATGGPTRAGRRWDAVELTREVAALDAGPGAQRISADRPTVELATLLLAVPLDGLGEDEAQEARRGRFEAVLATARAFAAVCRADPEKRTWWCGKMFSLRARARADGGDPTSRWQAVEEDVAEAELVEAELERGRQAAREHLAAKAAAEAAEAAKLAAGRSPERMAEALAAAGFMRRDTAGGAG